MLTHPLQYHRHTRSHPMRTRAMGGHFVKTAPLKDETPKHAALVKQAEKWISQTFYGQMMKEMRNSPFKSKMFSGGRGGEAFGEMFDQQMADRMSHGAGAGLVDALVSKFEHNQPQPANGTTKTSIKPNTSLAPPVVKTHLDPPGSAHVTVEIHPAVNTHLDGSDIGRHFASKGHHGAHVAPRWLSTHEGPA